MKTGTKISKSKRAKAAFRSWDMTGTPEVTADNGKVYHKMHGEKFVESPTLSKKYGKNYYYISNRGHLISFKNPGKPRLIEPEKAVKDGKNRRDRYSVVNHNDHHLIHRLVAEAFEVYAYGLATQSDHVHHTRRYRRDKSIVFNNNPQYLEYVTERVHRVLNILQERPRNKRTAQEELEIMQAIAYVAGIEEPNRITVVVDDPELTAIYATDEVKFSARAYIQLQLMIEAWMCAAYLNTQGLNDSIKYPVYVNIEQGTKKQIAIAVCEYLPEERKSVFVPCTAEEMRNIYTTMKEITDSLLRGYQLFSQGYRFVE